MLVLSRKLGEAIVIGHGIKVTVVAILKDGVRLGVDADRDVPVDRVEIRKKKDSGDERKPALEPA